MPLQFVEVSESQADERCTNFGSPPFKPVVVGQERIRCIDLFPIALRLDGRYGLTLSKHQPGGDLAWPAKHAVASSFLEGVPRYYRIIRK